MLSVVVLKDEDDIPVGIASRVSQFSESTELLTRGILVDDDWLVTLSGEGSFFIRADSNLWPFLKETLDSGLVSRSALAGSAQLTVRRLVRAKAVRRSLRARLGRFANLEGTAVESYEISGFDKIQGPGGLNARLFVSLPGQATQPRLGINRAPLTLE